MRMKVYIIDEAHMLTKEGANAFLKTLEEPPPHAVFILATTEPEKLPVTILSRCQRYAFRRIAIPVMIARMREIAAAEGIAIDEAALSAIAYRADGGLRDALTMLEQAAAFADGKITTQTIDLAFGATGRNYAGTLLDRLVARDANGVLKTIDDVSDAGTDMPVLIRSLIAEFRNLLVGRIDGELLSRDLAPEDAERAVARGKHFTQAQIIRALRLLTEALATARSSGHPRLELETALLRYVLASEDTTLDAISARVSALEEGLAVRPIASAAPSQLQPSPQQQTQPQPRQAQEARPPERVEAPAPSSNESITIQKVRAAWQSIRTKVESEKQSLRVQLSRAVPDSIDGKALVIKLPNSFMVDTLKDHAGLLESAIDEVLGTPLRVAFKVDGAAPRTKGGSAASTAATLQDGAEPAQSTSNDDPEELFSYLNERIK
jgi:DNA polymerase III subunit gamma/tau